MKKEYCIKHLVICLLLLSSINLAKAANYYWIGGAGNWSDINHWATTSGGSIIQTVVPGPSDDVFFDAGSGFTTTAKTVTLNVIANCHNMTWSGAPNNPIIQNGSQSTLNLYGSLVLQTGMTFNVSDLWFLSANPETITTNGVQVGSGFYQHNCFNGNGSWTFQDNFSGALMNVYKGTLNTNNKYVKIYQLNETGPGPAILNLGSSLIDVMGGDFGPSWATTLPTTTVSAASCTINLNKSGATMNVKAADVYNDVNYTNSTGVEYLNVGNGSRFHNVFFAGSTNIGGGSARFNSMICQGLTYVFQSSTTQTITSVLTSTRTTCSGLTDIHASTQGTQANLNVTGATVIINNALVKDMNIVGGTITATTSFDLGNNTNWVFPASTAKNLYWVGGTGDWNDANHWSLTSGGTGGACIPTLLDDVFFDANSGYTAAAKTTTINGAQAYCHNMTWSGAPNNPIIQDGSQNILSVYGSLVLQTGMTFNVSNLWFLSANPETITTNGVQVGSGFYQSNYFNGNGSWTFQDNFSGALMIVNKGTLNTNNKYVKITS